MSTRQRWLWAFVLAAIFRRTIPNSIIILEDGDCSPCYRRLLSGKKSVELHVRRAVECGRIEDCHRACDYEKYFVCEGFNYRRIGHVGTRGMCEMTSVPYSRMDIHQDFVSDPQCDYYERDPNCSTNPYGTRPSWWNEQAKPSQSYGPPYSSQGRPDARPYTPDRRPPNEVPRPLDYDRRPTKDTPQPLDYDRRPINEIPRPLDYNRRPIDRPSQLYGDPHRELYDNAFDPRGYQIRDRIPIHDGYPPARPEDRFTYSGRFPPRRPVDDFYNRNLPWARYPNRRLDHGPTQDIGTNEIGPYLPNHRKDPNRDWLGPYGDVYGGSYGYDTNYVGKFDVPKHPKAQPKPTVHDGGNFYGDFYNYGGAFGYGDNYIPANQDSLYGGIGKDSDECSVRAGAGFRLGRGVVRKTYLTPNLDQCESLCIDEKGFTCQSFSYRYNVAPTDPTDNCLLSDVSYKDLNFYTDLEPNRDYDIYAMITSSRTCSTKRKPSQHPPDECFWRVRSGFGMPADVTRKSIAVDNLGDCQAACTTTQDFTCRSFAFKYGLDQGQQNTVTNCYLSDWPSQDINPVNMPDMDGAELFERGSFGRGCEPYAVPFFNMGRFNGKQSPRRDEVCYSGHHRPCKLTPYVVLMATYVNAEQDCRRKCSKMRETDSVPCMSYSYKLTTHGTEENCLLSDVPIRDLRPGLDYTYDDDHVLYAWKDLDPHCTVTGYSVDDDHVFGDGGSSRPLLPARPYDFTPAADYHPGPPPADDAYPRPFFAIPKPAGHHQGVRPYDPDRPDPVRPHRPDGGYGADADLGYGTRPGGIGALQPDEHSTFQRYTVNGYPCKRGTRCERNKLAGFWACETEGGEYGSWDYCCGPAHRCGFSQGYHYPWCYVGASEDQWRPCSERYYPYLPSPRPMRPPVFANDDRQGHPDRSDTRDPSYYGRHWPITYLHREPPPNCTDSLASANNNNENRRSNNTTPATIEKSTNTIDTGNGTTARTRRRRLHSRMAFTNATRNDRVIFSRKIGTGIVASEARNRKRVAKIERVSSTGPFGAPTATAATVAPLATAADITDGFRTTNYSGGRFKHAGVGENVTMIRVPLIMPNNSLPAGA